MAPAQMAILRIFGQVTHTSLIKWLLQGVDMCKNNPAILWFMQKCKEI